VGPATSRASKGSGDRQFEIWRSVEPDERSIKTRGGRAARQHEIVRDVRKSPFFIGVQRQDHISRPLMDTWAAFCAERAPAGTVVNLRQA
jgi:hypothetical protein